jgi:hypothetical protein
MRYIVTIFRPADGRYQGQKSYNCGSWNALWRAKRRADEVAATPDTYLTGHARSVRVLDTYEGGTVYVAVLAGEPSIAEAHAAADTRAQAASNRSQS